MTDTVKSWIEERREARYGMPEPVTFENDNYGNAQLLVNGYNTTADGEFARAVADAHNMFPRALNALQQVLEEHSRQGLYELCDPTTCALDGGHDHIEVDYGEWVHADERVGWACFTCRGEDGEPSDWPCVTVQAIEGAINE